MGLNYSTRSTHYVDYSELQRYIKAVYGFEYPIVAAEETSNDTSLSYDIDGQIESWDREDFAKLTTGQWVPYRTRMLLNWMASEDRIPLGAYVVEICW
jgi:hypothetical protein